MNKKFLSAILFGALMVTSTGTFVSCKDYDDDIKNLQTQIDKNSSAIAELQKLVGQGKWVSSISSIENGFTVTMSDGSSHQIKGINGKDGKNGTEWTIGEDGFWYMNGEKTDNVAVGKNGENGKDGLTAPSPSIGADGNWLVYSWDAEKGEFVAESTEIPAAGTAAYVVEADGVYTLHIADANGEYQEIALPATCDSYVVEAPSAQVYVSVQKAEWNPKKNDKVLEALTKKFPELAELKKGDNLTQGGELPLMVNPTNVDLSEGYTFQLVDAKGKIADIAVENPVAGISDEWRVGMGGMSRSTDAKGGLWTLSVAPAYDEEAEQFAYINAGALIATNAKGVSSRTAFAYQVNTREVYDVDIWGNGSVPYAESIDLLARYMVDGKEMPAPVEFENEYEGKYLIELTNALQIEKYGLSIAEDGHTLNIAKMPADMTNIDITLKVSVVGLNGKTDIEENKNLNIYQTVAANAELEAKSLELNGKDQIVKWAITDLGMTAVELDKVLSAGLSAEASYEWTDENDEEQSVSPAVSVVYYNKDGKTTSYKNEGKWENGAATEFGFVVNATNNDQWIAPAEYTVKFKAQSGASVIYSAETTLTTSLPAVTDAYIRLTPAFVEEGVLQVTGKVNEEGKVEYNLIDAFILKNVKILSITDAEYDETEEDKTVSSAWNWVNDFKLSVNTWTYDPADGTTWWSAAEHNQLYTTRSMVAKVFFFNNPLNVAEYNFDLVVKSELYSEDATKAITIDATKLSAIFGPDDATTKDVKENQIDIKKAITKAVVIAGTDKGKTYSLFDVTTPATSATEKDVFDFRISTAAVGAEPVLNAEYFTVESDEVNEYVLGADENLVEIEKADLRKFGISAVNFAKLDKEKFYITLNATQTFNGDEILGLYDLYAKWRKYYEKTGVMSPSAPEEIAEEDAAAVELYNKYVVGKKVAVKAAGQEVVPGKPAETKVKDGRLADVSVAFDDALEAAKYFDFEEGDELWTLVAVENAPTDVTGGKVTVPMTLTVKDVWGMIMKVPFEVTVKTSK